MNIAETFKLRASDEDLWENRCLRFVIQIVFIQALVIARHPVSSHSSEFEVQHMPTS